jgi:DNA-binding transcriptional MerR regulator/methylmalonyl-CoA mutase cobalamin-binding subunit
MAQSFHAIKAVAQQTGLSAHVIRIWEKRYKAVEPKRTGTNRRLYSDEQVQRLVLLRDLAAAGHKIGVIAPLPTATLSKLAAQVPAGEGTRAEAPPGSLLERCLAAVNNLDSRALETALKRGAVELGAQGLLHRLIAPLAQQIGDLWRDGVITAAHEHVASAVIRVFLGQTAKVFAATEGAPVLVVGTPAGQLHELGAMLAAAAAANLGWSVTYLGPSLPAAEIAGAACHSQARAVALSLVYPEDDPRLENELLRLRELLPPEIPILAGGRAATAYGDTLAKAGVSPIRDLHHFCAVLDGLRRDGAKRRAGNQ